VSVKALVVEGDEVKGKDTHAVVVKLPNGATSPGTAAYDWKGKTKAGDGGFFTVGGTPVCTKADKTASGPSHTLDASSVTPQGTVDSVSPTPSDAAAPSQGAGSSFLKVAGQPVLLDKDTFDGCDNAIAAVGNLTVTASQSFFTVREE
jgi:hypothetical protein